MRVCQFRHIRKVDRLDHCNPASGRTINADVLRSRASFMLRLALLFGLVSLGSFMQTGANAKEPVQLVLDTDIGNDIDDTLALALIHALANRGEVRLLAVTITKDNRYAAPFVDLVNTFYGRPDIPVGVVRGGKTPKDSPMIQIPAQRRNANGQFVYPHRLSDGALAPEAVQLLTQVLTAQPDGSVTLAQIGFSTNLARLLKSTEGLALVRRKVKLLVIMGGNFVAPEPEYNIYTDPDSAKVLLENWPTPIVFSGFEVGSAVLFPYQSIEKDFNYTDNHPVAEAYRIFLPKGEDRPAWDPTAVLEAIRPDRNYFDLSTTGRVELGPKNTTVFTPNPNGNCRYLIVNREGALRVKQLLADLVSEPPQRINSPAQSRVAVLPSRIVF